MLSTCAPSAGEPKNSLQPRGPHCGERAALSAVEEEEEEEEYGQRKENEPARL